MENIIVEPYCNCNVFQHHKFRNIFFGKLEHFQDIDIPEDSLTVDCEEIRKKKDVHMSFTRYPFKYGNITNLNVINIKNKGTFKKSVDAISKATIKKLNDNVIIDIKTDSTDVEYCIDNTGNITKENKVYCIKKNFYTLNLKDVFEYKSIYFNYDIKEKIPEVEKLIIPTSIIGKKSTIVLEGENKNLPYLKVNNIEIVDDNDMKLIPNNDNKILNINNYIYFDNLDNNFVIYVKDKNEVSKAITIDKSANVEIMDKSKLVKKFVNYKNIIISDKEDNSVTISEYDKHRFIIKYKDGHTEFLNRMFSLYIPIMLKKYKVKNINPTTIQIENDIENILIGYQNFLKKLDKLNKMGLSKKVLYYTLYKDYDDFKSIEKLIINEELDENEVKTLDNYGKMLIRRKKLGK